MSNKQDFYEIFHEIWKTKGLKYEICMKFNGNVKFATEIWNTDVINFY